MKIDVTKIEKLLEKEFEFLIQDFGYTLEKSKYLTEIYLHYKTRKRGIDIFYEASNQGLTVDLYSRNIIVDLFFGKEGELGFNSEIITKGDIKSEDVKKVSASKTSEEIFQIYNSNTIDDVNIDAVNLYKRIMLDYLPDVLNGKKWIKLKTPKIKNFQ